MSLGINSILAVVLAVSLFSDRFPVSMGVNSIASDALPPGVPPNRPNLMAAIASPQLGERHQLTYDNWLTILDQEAGAVAASPPDELSILVGDSISLWFPPDVLPSGTFWLNQGISGETSEGLLNRLNLFAATQPDRIFVMIGINDLIRGIQPDTVLANQRAIIQTLKQQHPAADIIVQSMLPHSSDQATWEGRDRLLQIPNTQIQLLNRELAAIAQAEGVDYLDLYPLFTDDAGRLDRHLTTDGLHLSNHGYWVWRSALQMHDSQ